MEPRHTVIPVEDREQLTRRQKEIYAWLVDFFFGNDNFPSTRIISKAFNWRSQTAAMSFYRILVRKKWIEPCSIPGKYKFIRPIQIDADSPHDSDSILASQSEGEAE